MRYTFVSWENSAKRWACFCPAWPGVVGRGESKAASMAHLSELLNTRVGALVRDGCPPIEDVAVHVDFVSI